MVILGIHGDYFNEERQVFESNAGIVRDGKIICAFSEERLSRTKLDGRFPWLAIDECLKVAKMKPSDVDEVVFSTRNATDNAMAYAKSMWSTYRDTGVMPRNKGKISKNKKGLVSSIVNSDKKTFSFKGQSEKEFNINYRDHHYSHAAGAFYCSPFDDALVITLDGGGNGLDGGAYRASGTDIQRFIEIPHFQSPGTMYSAITHDLGFKRHRHEGKITGLAAYGSASLEQLEIEDLIVYDKRKHRFISKAVADHHKDLQTNSKYFTPLLKKFSKEDVSGGVQLLFEKVICDFVTDAVEVAKKKGFSSRHICLAGGCFANVKLNERIYELGLFDNIFVFPAMGDGGLGAGAALYHYYQENRLDNKRASEVNNVYLGGDFSEDEMIEALKSHKLDYERFDEIEVELGKLLADGKIIARFNGAMEYGPRALGNRSIIGAPFDASINDWLNKKLNRTEFMPFAPSVTEEAAPSLFKNYRPDHKAAEFMTITYEMQEGLKDKIPAVVHVDNTARPQVVRKDVNASYHKIIAEFGKHSGIDVVLNTSFNIHEEPIVYTPDDAIRGFLGAQLDYLAMGPFLVKLPDSFGSRA